MTGRGAARLAHATARKGGREQGTTLVELLVAAITLSLLLLGFGRFMAVSMVTAGLDREAALAEEAARSQLEVLRAEDLTDVFARYNALPDDDAEGIGTAPGKDFAVANLVAMTTDADGMAGEILLPETPPGVLREDQLDPLFGLPLDLNGDGLIDAADHAGDYAALPVVVRVEWTGQSGPARVEIRTTLGAF